MRWLLLDEVVLIEKGVLAQTRSHVPAEEVGPEILMMEMMAQTGALLLGAENDFQEDLVFAKIEKADFQRNLHEGDVLHIEAESENLRPEGAWMDGRIHHDEDLVATSRFLLMNVGHLVRGETKPITFHDAFMNYFRIRDRIK
jgi:3-hydroxymyristoyl/3-hydroxydecanoyl-(acyl carrier protein) dehydratase